MVFNQSNRRSFIKKAGLAGVVPFGNLSLNDNDTVKLPDLRNQDEVVKKVEVPKPWQNHRNAAEKARDAMVEKFHSRNENSNNESQKTSSNTSESSNNGVVEIALESAPETYGGKKGFQVAIAVNPDKLDKEIPDEANGVPVRTEERNNPPVPLCKNSTYDDVKGGVKIAPGEDAGYGSTGFVVSAFTGFTVEPHVTTAAHVLAEDYDEVYGDGTRGDYEQIGNTSAVFDEDLDFAFFESSRDIQNKIESEDTTYDLGGWVTEDGIATRAVSTDRYWKHGATTGETMGYLDKYKIDEDHPNTKSSFDGEGVRGAANVAGGDSGSAGFVEYDNKYYITHQNSHAYDRIAEDLTCGEPTYKFGFGISGYRINSLSGVSILGSSID